MDSFNFYERLKMYTVEMQCYRTTSGYLLNAPP